MRPRLPPLRALQAFEAVARCATFARAAAELGVTPSAVSHQIQLLEAFLGVHLFRRHAGRAALTEAGQIYAQEVKGAFGLIADATTLVAPQSQTGHLVIASSPSFAAKWLQPRLEDFLRAHPEVKIRLSTWSGGEILTPDRYDIAITYGRPNTAHGQVDKLLSERLRPLCSPGLAASLDLRSPDDLSRAILIHSVNALTWAEYLRRIGHGAVRAANELWLDRSTIAIDAAVAGMGVVLESELLAEQELADGRLIAPFASPAYGVETDAYFLVRPAGSRTGRNVALFERWLRGRLAIGVGTSAPAPRPAPSA